MSTSKTASSKTARRYNPDLPVTEQILAHAQDSRDVIQDFVPLADSLEWELGQRYLRERGNKAFISDASPVPFVINNDGTLSRNAAELFFASLIEAENAGDLEADIFVLELGIGVGLFARFFLDNFRELCLRHKKDFYERLTYVAADRSERMLMDVLRHGVLANHPGRYRVRQVDAMQPGAALPRDAAYVNHSGKPFRAVFLNYLLDCLPATVLEFDGEQAKQLCVRTLVARNLRLADFTDMTMEQLRERANSTDPRAKQELLEVYGLFASEYDYRPVEVSKLPLGNMAHDYSKRRSKRVLHSYGAIQSLDRLLDLVHEKGFILINDYGQTMETRDSEFEHQRFSMATFVGVNFALLEDYFGKDKKARWEKPPGEEKGIHSRLLSRNPSSETITRYYELFSAARHEDLQAPLAKARACLRVARFELAGTFYQEALVNQPRNWVLINEVSMFLTFTMRKPKEGLDMAKIALTLNPGCSSELWNALGDGLYEFGRTAEARSAYLRSMQVNGSDVRARYNLAWVYTREKNFPAALGVLAEALGLDKTGEYRDRLLQKLQEVVGHLAQRHQQEYLLLINLVSKYVKQDEKEKPKAEAARLAPLIVLEHSA